MTPATKVVREKHYIVWDRVTLFNPKRSRINNNFCSLGIWKALLRGCIVLAGGCLAGYAMTPLCIALSIPLPVTTELNASSLTFLANA